jgi:hypothetical protein
MARGSMTGCINRQAKNTAERTEGVKDMKGMLEHNGDEGNVLM